MSPPLDPVFALLEDTAGRLVDGVDVRGTVGAVPPFEADSWGGASMGVKESRSSRS